MSFPSPRFVLFAILAACLCGCGAERYDARRLSNTKPFLTDRAELDDHLDSYWSAGGVLMRLPAGFEEQKIPDEGPVAIPLPNGRRVNLPGVLGVFTRPLGAATDEGETAEVPGLIAVLSSRRLQESQEDDEKHDPRKRIEPKEFHGAVAARLAASGASRTIKEDTVPVGGQKFQPTLQYKLARYQTPGHGVLYNISLYQYREPNGNTRIAIIVMAPKQLAPDEPLGRQIDLSLRTLWVTEPGSGGPETVGATGPNF